MFRIWQFLKRQRMPRLLIRPYYEIIGLKKQKQKKRKGKKKSKKLVRKSFLEFRRKRVIKKRLRKPLIRRIFVYNWNLWKTYRLKTFNGPESSLKPLIKSPLYLFWSRTVLEYTQRLQSGSVIVGIPPRSVLFYQTNYSWMRQNPLIQFVQSGFIGKVPSFYNQLHLSYPHTFFFLEKFVARSQKNYPSQASPDSNFQRPIATRFSYYCQQPQLQLEFGALIQDQPLQWVKFSLALVQVPEVYLYAYKLDLKLASTLARKRITLLSYFTTAHYFKSQDLIRIGSRYPGYFRRGWLKRYTQKATQIGSFLLRTENFGFFKVRRAPILKILTTVKKYPRLLKQRVLRYFKKKKFRRNQTYLSLSIQTASLKIDYKKPLLRQPSFYRLMDLTLLPYILNQTIIFKYLWSALPKAPLGAWSTFLAKQQSLIQYTYFMPTNQTNLNLHPLFTRIHRRHVLRLLRFRKFLPNTTMWAYQTILRFIELLAGKKTYMRLNPFIQNSLTFLDLARCHLWKSRILGFQKMLGPRIFLLESVQIIYMAIKYKDPTLLTNWIEEMLLRIKFWSYRRIFRYLKYVLKVLLKPYFAALGFKGLKLKLKGKIAVAGNARTRTLFYRIGLTSHSTLDNRIHQTFQTFDTFTGVLGFRLWFFF